MARDEQPYGYVVVLQLLTPGPVRSEHVARLEGLLTDAPAPDWWSLRVRQSADTVRLDVGVVATGHRAASRAVVDHVRARLGLDSVFSLWVVDARHALVRDRA